MKVRCQICYEWIAEVSRGFLSFPMTGAMFKAVEPMVREQELAFNSPSVTWEDFRCPYGNHRPMIEDNQLMTEMGLIILERDGSPMKREELSTERTVKKREPIKRAAEGPKGKAPKAYACKVCKKEFPEEINLNRHVRMAHREVTNG